MLISVPTITRHPENGTALVDRRFDLHCRATGDPAPRITWELDDKRVANRRRLSRITRRGTLRFLEIRPTDAGWYRCKAQNDRGLKYSHKAFLSVHGKGLDTDSRAILCWLSLTQMTYIKYQNLQQGWPLLYRQANKQGSSMTTLRNFKKWWY